MRKLILLGLMAAAALPAAAGAQSYHELRHDRRDIRHEQRQLRAARATGDRRDIRYERHDVRDARDARQEYRADLSDRNRRWGRDDWYRYRQQDRRLYARGDWRAPFGYAAFRPGARLRGYYYQPRYFISDPWRYRLPPIYGYQRWVRHYNDVLLVDIRSGIVLRVIRGFYW